MTLKAEQLAPDLRTSFAQVGQTGPFVYARLGKGDGSGTIVADFATRKVWYFNQDNNQVPAIAPVAQTINFLALNDPQLEGTRIRLGYPSSNPKILHVLDFDTGEGLQALGGITAQEQLASKAQYPTVGNITNLRLMPQSPPDTSVFVNPSPFYDRDGNWSFWGGDSFDLADTIAALTSGQHQMVVVCLDITAAELVLFTNIASDGGQNDKDLFNWTTIATEISITDIYIACGAVHLYEGQTEVVEDDIYRSADPRAAFGKPIGSSSGGGGVGDKLYLSNNYFK